MGRIAVERNAPVEVEDVFADPHLEDWWQPAREPGFAAMISLPLWTGYIANGAVSFCFATARRFTDEERRLLLLIAEQLAATAARVDVAERLSIENDRLQRENDNLAHQLDAAQHRARRHDELMIETGHDLARALRSIRQCRSSDDTSAAIATDALDDASPMTGVPVTLDAGDDMVPIATDGTPRSRFAAIPTTHHSRSTMHARVNMSTLWRY